MNQFDEDCENETEADQQKIAIQQTTDYAQDLVKDQFKQIEQLIENDQSQNFLKEYIKYMENKNKGLDQIQKIQLEINDIQKKINQLEQSKGLQGEVYQKQNQKQQLKEEISKLKDRQIYYQKEIWSFSQKLMKFN